MKVSVHYSKLFYELMHGEGKKWKREGEGEGGKEGLPLDAEKDSKQFQHLKLVC